MAEHPVLDFNRIATHAGLFFNMTLEEVTARALVANTWQQDLWGRYQPKSDAEYKDMYTIMASPIFEQLHWHYRQCIALRRSVSEKLKGRVLNFGCGVASESFFAAAERGIQSDLFELPGIMSAFLRFIIDKENLSSLLRLHNITLERELVQYDTIVCIDVLEHIEDPMVICNLFKDHLAPDGVVLFRAPFWYLIPGHLPQHKDLIAKDLLVAAGIPADRLHEVDV